MLPKPRQDLVPNTAEFERLPFVKPTGFREYDARWRYPEEINLLGLQAVGLGLGHADARPRRAGAGGGRPRLPFLFGRGESGADHRPAGRRRRGARHRPGAVAHGLFRAIRARGRRRRHGHRQPQRQWLDGDQDGRRAPPHLRPRGHDRAEGYRPRRRLSPPKAQAGATFSCRTCQSAIWPICWRGRNCCAH